MANVVDMECRTSNRGMTGTMLEDGEFRCALCWGKGVQRSGKGRCPACGGRGFVKVTPPAVMCAYCRGRGEVPVRSGITCTVCNGNGVVSVREPVEACHDCCGTGATADSKLPCLVCGGKGVVVATNEYGEATRKARGERLGWAPVGARRAMVEVTRKGHGERSEIQAEASPICLQGMPFPAHDHEADQEREAGCVSQPDRSRETKMVRAGVVSGLVRRLMAAERARILNGRTIDLGRYTLERRAQRWRESRGPLK